MGGQNHQPTNKKGTASSAWLSKKIGEAVIALQSANNHLEDAIIIGLRPHDPAQIHERITAVSSAASLRLSRQSLMEMKGHLAHIDEGFDQLLNVCAQIGYTGNPLAPDIEDFDLRTVFKRHDVLPHVNAEAWEDVATRIRDTNIIATLRWEQGEFRKLATPTNHLITITQQCTEIAERDGDEALADALEDNGIPYRHHYARVFARWNYLQAMFLYSALMMTELYYRKNGFGSLTTTDITDYAVAS